MTRIPSKFGQGELVYRPDDLARILISEVAGTSFRSKGPSNTNPLMMVLTMTPRFMRQSTASFTSW
jgi:hypothetical protein